MICRIILFVITIVLVQSNPSITELEDSHNENNTEYEIANGRIHMTLKQYYCAWKDSNNSKPLTFGAKSWIFPKQDVNLVLSYPDKNQAIKSNEVITKFNVFIKIDSSDSRGYITSGGILQDHISLSFVLRGITSLSYQFWLYGMSSDYIPRIDPYTNIQHMC